MKLNLAVVSLLFLGLVAASPNPRGQPGSLQGLSTASA